MLNDILSDGFYQHYILTPPDNSNDEVFFTLWDYRRLQKLWAKENGLSEEATLNDIRIAQIRHFNADVVFDFSPFRDLEFIEQARAEIANQNMLYLCWNAYIKDHAMTFPQYDAHVSLHQPYVDYWRQLKLHAYEMQPGVPKDWSDDAQGGERTIDILFYGQYLDNVFKNRRELINTLLDYRKASNKVVDVHLQILPKADTSAIERNLSAVKEPIFGSELYGKIRQAKVVVNICTDFNESHKSNARVFEALGNGALLIAEAGSYPMGLVAGEDFIVYNDMAELPALLDKVFSNWDDYKKVALRGHQKVHDYYGRPQQWQVFSSIVEDLRLKVASDD
ncbi:MAG: glycosyltransferase [Idiomarina sp.]